MSLATIPDAALKKMIVAEQEILLTLDNCLRFDRATALQYHETKKRLSRLLEEEKKRREERDFWRGKDY